MELYLLITLLLSVILIIILYLQYKKKKELVEKLIFDKHKLETLRKEEIKGYFEEEWKQEEKELKHKEIQLKGEIAQKTFELESKFEINQTQLNGQIKQLQVQLDEKEKRYNEVNQDLDLYREGKMKEIDGTAAEYEQRKRTEIEQILKQAELNANSSFNNQVDSYLARRAQMESELEEVQKSLEEERTKRAAINEEIRRRREVEEQQDFYKIQFSDEDRNDVEILRSVAPRLRHPEAINKVIWSTYYQKPLTELRKRLLPNGDKSGIYKITRLKTGEIYIGSTTSFDTRFVNHYKTALGVGTLASSQLHRMMREDGPEHFTVEILEEDVPKEKLKERESYYIDFYDSKNYGLNTIRGEQK